jgi:hypothetical protein
VTPGKSLLGRVPDAVVYPLRGTGRGALLGGSILIGVVLVGFPRHGLLIWCFLLPYLYAYAVRIVNATAKGDPDPPHWPEVRVWEDEGFRSHGLLALVGVHVPVFACLALWPSFPGAALALGFLSVLYVPMAWLAIAMFRTAEALNPLFIGRAVLKAPLDYAVLCMFVALLWWLDTLVHSYLRDAVAIAGPFLAAACWLYGLVMTARLLGEFYWLNRAALAWEAE